MLGLALAGGLIATVGTGWVFVLNGASFAAVLGSRWVADHIGPRWALALGAASGFAAALVGLHYMVKHRRLRVTFGSAGLQFGLDRGGHMGAGFDIDEPHDSAHLEKPLLKIKG